MRPTEKYFKLFSNCIPVNGARRSAICDLQRNNIKLIPNDLYNILISHENKTIKQIKSIYGGKYNDIIDEYFEFLEENEFIFYTNDPDLFPRINIQFYYPFSISNAIIDRNKQSEYDIYKVLRQLEELKCKFVEIRFFDIISPPEIEKIMIYLNEAESIISSVGIIMQFCSNFKSHTDLIANFHRLSYIIIHNAEAEKYIVPPNNERGYIIYTKNKLFNEKNCGIISKSYFSSNIQLFTESLHHNSCLHKKIAIDTNGNIKNCPSMAQSFGNIQNTTLEEALNHPDFKKYWNIAKDQVAVCKDCEFRYICTDCRAYLENPEDMYSKPLKCGYNPYTNEWEEWSANPLKQKAIDFYGMQNILPL